MGENTRPPLKLSDQWMTPQWILDLVVQVDAVALDPCPGLPMWTRAKMELHLSEGEDGLAASWYALWSEDLESRGLIYVNPPFGRGHLDLWAPKIAAEAARGMGEGLEVIALLPATPGPEWWQDHIGPNLSAVCFLRGRPRFIDPYTHEEGGTGTKDVAIVYFGERASRFRRVFGDRGWCP